MRGYHQKRLRIQRIQQALQKGDTTTQVARRFGLDLSYVQQIKRRMTKKEKNP